MTETKYTPDVRRRVGPLTYFKDIFGSIYYLHCPMESEGVSGFRATHVYAADSNGNRVSLLDGQKYNKVIFHGISYERDLLKERVSKSIYKRLTGLVKQYQHLKDSFLFVPQGEVDFFYSPKGSLGNLLTDTHFNKKFTEDSFEKLQTTLNLFQEHSIPFESLGVYGGLQCYLVRDAEEQIKDIDLLIDGIEHYEKVRQLSLGNKVNPKSFEANTLKNPHAVQAAIRRGELSQLKLQLPSQVVCDVRLIRQEGDADSYPDFSLDNDFETVTIKGAEVIQADESLCLPYCFVIKTEAGQRLTVGGRYYEFIGAATLGDIVEVKGIKVSDDSIVITSAEEHYIGITKRYEDM